MRSTNVRSVTKTWVFCEVIAEHPGCTKDSIYTWVSKTDMPIHRVGRLWRFKVTEVDDWVRSSGTDDTAKASKKGTR